MKTIAQLLLYPYITCALSPNLVRRINPNLMPVPYDIVERLKISDYLIDAEYKQCINLSTATKWILAEAVVYESTNCVYLSGYELVYISSLKGYKSIPVKPQHLEEDYLDKLKASYLIRWGARIQENPGEFIKVIDIDNKEYLTTPHSCDCQDFLRKGSCSHVALTKVYIKNRSLLDFLETN